MPKITPVNLEQKGFLVGAHMDEQIRLLANEMRNVEERISAKILSLDEAVRHLQIAEGEKTAIEYRLKTAETDIHLLFEAQRKMEEKYDAELKTLNFALSTKVAFWKGAAWLAGGSTAVIVVLIDIALNLYK